MKTAYLITVSSLMVSQGLGSFITLARLREYENDDCSGSVTSEEYLALDTCVPGIPGASDADLSHMNVLTNDTFTTMEYNTPNCTGTETNNTVSLTDQCDGFAIKYSTEIESPNDFVILHEISYPDGTDVCAITGTPKDIVDQLLSSGGVYRGSEINKADYCFNQNIDVDGEVGSLTIDSSGDMVVYNSSQACDGVAKEPTHCFLSYRGFQQPIQNFYRISTTYRAVLPVTETGSPTPSPVEGGSNNTPAPSSASGTYVSALLVLIVACFLA